MIDYRSRRLDKQRRIAGVRLEGLLDRPLGVGGDAECSALQCSNRNALRQ
jgi:hypothetical protein